MPRPRGVIAAAGACLAFRALAFRALAFRALAFRALAFRALAFRALAFRALAFHVHPLSPHATRRPYRPRAQHGGGGVQRLPVQ